MNHQWLLAEFKGYAFFVQQQFRLGYQPLSKMNLHLSHRLKHISMESTRILIIIPFTVITSTFLVRIVRAASFLASSSPATF